MAIQPTFIFVCFLILASLVDASWYRWRGQPLVCNFRPTKTNSARGRVVFWNVFHYRSYRCRVYISATFSGLTPNTKLGWHIHKYGDTGEEDGTGTGGHFVSPRNSKWRFHALPRNPRRHWGDLGNLYVTPNGTAAFKGIDNTIRLRGIIGRGMIIHARVDQGLSEQPSGAAGPRVAQCVIGIANPQKL